MSQEEGSTGKVLLDTLDSGLHPHPPLGNLPSMKHCSLLHALIFLKAVISHFEIRVFDVLEVVMPFYCYFFSILFSMQGTLPETKDLNLTHTVSRTKPQFLPASNLFCSLL